MRIDLRCKHPCLFEGNRHRNSGWQFPVLVKVGTDQGSDCLPVKRLGRGEVVVLIWRRRLVLA